MHNIELITFVIVGVLIALVQMSAHRKLRSTGIGGVWLYDGLILISNLFFFFGLLWAVSSLAENETQAAMMGILIFSGTGLILGIISYRLVTMRLAR